MSSTEAAIVRKAVGCAGSIVHIFVTLPAWLYLLHYVLTATGAGQVEWLIYWAYVPLTFTTTIMHLWGSRISD